MSNSFFPSPLMQRWKMVREGLTSINKLPRRQRRNKKREYPLRERVHWTHSLREKWRIMLTVPLRSQRWWLVQPSRRRLHLPSCLIRPVLGKGRVWWLIKVPSLWEAPRFPSWGFAIRYQPTLVHHQGWQLWGIGQWRIWGYGVDGALQLGISVYSSFYLSRLFISLVSNLCFDFYKGCLWWRRTVAFLERSLWTI